MKSLKERHYLTRHPERIRSSDVIEGIFEDISYYPSPDPSLIAAKGYVDGIECIVLGQEKRREGKESIATGMITSAGHEYILEILDEAEKHNSPVVSFIDTYGGDATMQSELGGQSFRISDCIRRYCEIETPTVSYIIGEGGSGGALAMQIADESYMLENSMYSVIAPESCARIIFGKRIKAGEKLEDLVDEALDILRPGVEHLQEIGMVDGSLTEPDEGAHTNYDETIGTIKNSLVETLNKWIDVDKKSDEKRITNGTVKKLVKDRKNKVLNYGKFDGSLTTFVKRKLKRIKRIGKSKSVEEVPEINDPLIAPLRKEELDKKNIVGRPVVCKDDWGIDGRYRVAGGCGYIGWDDYEENFYACPHCGKGDYLTVEEQITKICDEDSFHEIDENLTLERLIGKETYLDISIVDVNYSGLLKKSAEVGTSNESLVTGKAEIEGREVVLAISDIRFMGGSFGAVYGEKFKRAVDLSVKEKIPLISVCSSGGARMYEGPMSLAQMAKMNMALLDLKKSNAKFISVIAEPTTGGASASYATQGDIMIGERGSLMAFAGPKVVIGSGISVDKKVVCTNKLHETDKIDDLVDRRKLKALLSYYVESFYNDVHPEKRVHTGRITFK